MPSAGTTSQEQSSRSGDKPRFELSRGDLLLQLLPDRLGVFPGVGLRDEPVADSVAAIEALVVANQHGARSGRIEPKQQRVGHGQECRGLPAERRGPE